MVRVCPHAYWRLIPSGPCSPDPTDTRYSSGFPLVKRPAPSYSLLTLANWRSNSKSGELSLLWCLIKPVLRTRQEERDDLQGHWGKECPLRLCTNHRSQPVKWCLFFSFISFLSLFRSLLQQLQKLQSLISGKVVPRSCKMASTQTGTCLMVNILIAVIEKLF